MIQLFYQWARAICKLLRVQCTGLFPLLIVAPFLLTSCASPPQGAALPRIIVAPTGNSFITARSKERFVPWGVNYGNAGRLMEDFWVHDWPTLAGDFHEIKQMGGNSVRLHLQFGKFMDAPDQLNPLALKQLQRLLKLAEHTGLYLDLTGLACYRPTDVPAWYDQLDDAARWEAQAVFWRAIAHECAGSPAVFCYDLMNEPISPGQTEKWYSGQLLGGYDFIQFIARNPANTNREQLAVAWTRKLAGVIRAADANALVTVGLLPWDLKWKHLSAFVPGEIAPYLDFISVHLYPDTKQPDAALLALRECAVGKPVLIEETFALSCTVPELEKFLHASRKIACGWIWHYDGRTVAQYERLEPTQRLTPAQVIWRANLKSFIRLGPEFKTTTAPANTVGHK